MRVLLTILSTLVATGLCFSQVPEPKEFLSNAYGKSFTPHHELVDYFYRVSELSSLVSVREYGRTNQQRPLIYAVVSSESNLKNLDKIRENNLIRCGLKEGKTASKYDKAIVWLSFGVHGNEAAASECAMQVVHALATGSHFVDHEWLENCVVIIDPCLNPDGYNRYTNWHINVNGDYINPDRRDIEHREPWPFGRGNHYLHDLNRDWAWATQIETKQRLHLYHQWLPHIHADFHEMNVDDHYYFAPAAKPHHAYITDWQIEFQTEIGLNHARYFDREGWMYFTGEEFDLFYPSYGDTYPTFNGAIGMTYEQAGSRVAGRSVIVENGDTLTLQDRIDHHLTTALSTVEIASASTDKMLEEFENFFQRAVEAPSGDVASYVIKNKNALEISELTELLDLHQIQYGQLKSDQSISGFHFPSLEEQDVLFEKGDLVIPVRQPQGTLVQVLFEPDPSLEDSLTYDITAWSLLAAFGMEGVASRVEVDFEKFQQVKAEVIDLQPAYAFIVQNRGWASSLFVKEALAAGIKCRLIGEAFEIEGQEFDVGSIAITRSDNSKKELTSILNRLSNKTETEIFPVQTGFTQSGPDLGSASMKLLKSPKVLLVGGDDVNTYNFGQCWYYLDKVLAIPYTVVMTEDFIDMKLADFNSIILPDGKYKEFNESVIKEINGWIKEGGNLIAFDQALKVLDRESDMQLDLGSLSNKHPKETATDKHRVRHYEITNYNESSNWMPGCIVRLTMDNSHPMAYGYGKHYLSLKRAVTTVPVESDLWNVGWIEDEVLHLGFIGSDLIKDMDHTTSVFVRDIGDGHLTGFIDNPLYRSFWVGGRHLFFNSLFYLN